MEKQKVLLIEDDKIIVSIYKLKLEKLGFDVKIALNGDDAITELGKQIPDVILLDLLLPKKDGFQVLAEIKNNPSWSSIPVVVSSNLGQSEDIKKALKMGANEYFIKSNVDIDDVINTVQKAAGNKT